MTDEDVRAAYGRVAASEDGRAMIADILSICSFGQVVTDDNRAGQNLARAILVKAGVPLGTDIEMVLDALLGIPRGRAERLL